MHVSVTSSSSVGYVQRQWRGTMHVSVTSSSSLYSLLLLLAEEEEECPPLYSYTYRCDPPLPTYLGLHHPTPPSLPTAPYTPLLTRDPGLLHIDVPLHCPAPSSSLYRYIAIHIDVPCLLLEQVLGIMTDEFVFMSRRRRRRRRAPLPTYLGLQLPTPPLA